MVGGQAAPERPFTARNRAGVGARAAGGRIAAARLARLIARARRQDAPRPSVPAGVFFSAPSRRFLQKSGKAAPEAASLYFHSTPCRRNVKPIRKHKMKLPDIFHEMPVESARPPFRHPGLDPGSIPDSRHRRSRWRADSTAETAARTEAGPRLGGRGDGWGEALQSHRRQMCAYGSRHARERA